MITGISMDMMQRAVTYLRVSDGQRIIIASDARRLTGGPWRQFGLALPFIVNHVIRSYSAALSA